MRPRTDPPGRAIASRARYPSSPAVASARCGDDAVDRDEEICSRANRHRERTSREVSNDRATSRVERGRAAARICAESGTTRNFCVVIPRAGERMFVCVYIIVLMGVAAC